MTIQIPILISDLYISKCIIINKLWNIFKELGNSTGARDQFNKVLAISPDYSWAYYNLAVLDYENEDYEDALENLSKAVELNPSDIEAYKIYAKISAKLGDYEDAEETIIAALENCGENGDLYYIAGRICALQGDNIKYRLNLQNALKNYKTLTVSVSALKTELSRISL